MSKGYGRMQSDASYTFGSEHDRCTTSTTANVALWSNDSSDKKAPDLSPNPELSDELCVAQNECASEQPFIALVLKHSKASPDVLKHCEILSDAALHAKYPSEYQSWRNMKRRSGDGIRQIHLVFADFRLFLMCVGAKPKPPYTLDRPDNCNLEYSPTNARWASKREQNRNKSDTVVVVCPKTGKKWFAADLAKKHSVMPDTIRAQRRRGWTDAEMIAGCRLPDAAKTAVPSVKPATTLEPDWHYAMVTSYPDSLALLPVSAKKMLGRFEDVCGDAGVSAATVLSVVIAHWIEFTRCAASERGLNNKQLPDIPQPRFLAAHPEAAINYWARKVGCNWQHGRPILPPTDSEKVAKPKEPPTPTMLHPPDPVLPTKPKEQKPTMEELWRILKED